MKNILVILIMFLFIIPVIANDELNPYEKELLWLENANVEQDVKKAIESHDFRIKCVMGYALRCPGIKNRKGLEYSLIKGTGDIVTSDKHDKLLDMATKYAKTYNKYIIEAKKKIEKAQ